MTVRTGTRFFYLHADSKPEWKVVEKRGKDTWLATVVSDDWHGTKKVFGTEEIEEAIDRERRIEALFERRDNFWESRTVGEILHYHDSFGRYVRGEVVRRNDKMVFVPTALVGAWSGTDLPMRMRHSYHVKRILNPENDSTWQPNESSVFEAKTFSRPFGPNREFDPRTAVAIDLSDPPELEGEAAIEAKYEKLRMDLTGILGNGHRDPKAALEMTAKLIAELGL